MKKLFWKSRTFVLVLRQNGLSTLTAALRHWVHAILPLSSSPRGSRMFFRGIMCFALVALVSCKSVDVVTNAQVQEVQTLRTVDTVVLHDSIFIREVMRGDTVYLTRTEWRDRWRTRLVHDTIRDTQVVEKVIEKPPVRYVPKFYKWCTVIFWISAALLLVYLFLKYRLRVT